MRPLIDGDILLHELGWSAEFPDKESGDTVLLDFDHVLKLLNEKMQVIRMDTGADEEPLIFISDSEALTNQINRERRLFGEHREFVPNFRYETAKTKPYKGNRKNPKPFHFNNLIAYFRSEYDTIISEDGYEADDEMGIFQVRENRAGRDTIICSRDKDLRIIPGNHYSWECGGQRSIGPANTDRLGRLGKNDRGEVLGYGQLFFYYQMLCGDSADNIPGLPRCGTVAAYGALHQCETEEAAFRIVKDLYRDKLGSGAKEYFLEQANLLWITQERGKGYEFPTKA